MGGLILDSRVLRKRDELLGKEFTTKNYGKCFIIDYKGRGDVTVMFYDPVGVTKCGIDNLNKGCVANPSYHFKHPTVYGVGIVGQGKYTPYNYKRIYKIWTSLIQRCYDESFKKRCPTYEDVEVCKKWHNFQNFAEWCNSQKLSDVKDDNGKSYQLDKDILVKGNKIYSPETCCFVPSEINSLFISCKKVRGNLPVGVSLHKGCKKYSVTFKKSAYRGGFDTPEQAFLYYKKAKEDYIKDVAKKYASKIDEKIYKALISWEICIDD